MLTWVATATYAQQPQPDIHNSINASTLQFPWAGGMNSMQFGEMDLNLDGIMDLVALDRDEVNNQGLETAGNRKYCFINQGIADSISYQWAGEYADQLPELYNWFKFRDYNGDGKMDIFTYSPGWSSMIVYRNASVTSLKFELMVYPYLTSFQNGGYVNILVTYVDYPGIADIDNDGDLDILSFWGLGSFVEMHKNMSMEKYGHADSLDFMKTEPCWGYFAESDESNHIYLDSCNTFVNSGREALMASKERHTGSTFLLLDMDGDQDKDLLLGDVDFPSLFELNNTGSKENAYIGSYDTIFPGPEENIHLYSMPAASFMDVNNDGLKDLLVSPFDPDIEKSENKNSVWLYLNSGENNKPIFERLTTSFLQDEMIDQGSGAYPIVFDWDQDGLDDLILGNHGFYQNSWYEGSILKSAYRGSLYLYKNTGSPENAAFQLSNKNLGNLWDENLLGIFPTAGDLDGDGEPELIVGHQHGSLILFQKDDNGALQIQDRNYASINVGAYSSPQLFDLDKDGLLDLIVGEQDGNLNYYHNDGSATDPIFSYVSDSLGKVSVRDIALSYDGFSTPGFFRGADGITGLLVGSNSGLIHYFTDIDDNLLGTFTANSKLYELLDTIPMSFDRGLRTAAVMTDLNHDSTWEMIVGNYAGGLEYFNSQPQVSPGWQDFGWKNEELKLFPNPANNTISIESDIHDGSLLCIYNASGKLVYHHQHKGKKSQISINVSDLKPGLYIIIKNQENERQLGKFLKK